MSKIISLRSRPVRDVQPSLKEALAKAIAECKGDTEEEGGILVEGKGHIIEFFKITNANAGTDIAVGLYTADRKEYGQVIIPKFNEGYKNYASFHTHPKGCRAMPSCTDFDKLFKGFPVNFIYAPWSGELNCFIKVKEDENGQPIWGWTVLKLFENE